jgi:hypothetical protein
MAAPSSSMSTRIQSGIKKNYRILGTVHSFKYISLTGCADLGGGHPSAVAKSKTPHSGLSDLGTLPI